jgi:hypothetical protein
MITYSLGMIFVGWLIAILMLLGFLFIKQCEKIVNNPELFPDSDVMACDAIIEEYNSRDLKGRVKFLFQINAILFSGGQN